MLVTETVTERNCKRSIYTTWCENVIDITWLISFWLSVGSHCKREPCPLIGPLTKILIDSVVHKMDKKPMEEEIAKGSWYANLPGAEWIG